MGIKRRSSEIYFVFPALWSLLDTPTTFYIAKRRNVPHNSRSARTLP